jgi:Fic family protein
MAKINKRQVEILEFIRKNPDSNSSIILEHIAKNYEDTSRITIIRDLNLLLKENLIEKQGEGRNVTYKELLGNKLLGFIDIDGYFKKDPDERNVTYKNFNFDIFNNLEDIFGKEEIKELDVLNKKYQNNIKKLPETALKKEFERLTIELSWKSSKIEGNTYSLIDTEVLIKENQEAEGHKKEEAVMILNHKKALDYIYDSLEKFKKLNIRDIEDVHRLIVEDLSIARGIRSRMVGITGTIYRPLDNQHQIMEALEKTVSKLNKMNNPFSKALLAILLISYIQPFEDGNKRTARLMANAILLANNACPLSFRSINETDYKKAVVLFYEQNNASFFKKLFVEQFKFSVENYFL